MSQREGREWGTPLSIRIFPAHESAFAVEEVSVVGGSLRIESGFLCFSQTLRQPCRAPVVHTAFQRTGDRLAFDDIEGVVPVFVVEIPVLLRFAGMGDCERLVDRLEGCLLVNTGESL